MPVPSSITDLSTTAGSNSPSGSESPITADDYLRTISAFVATLRDGKGQSAEATVASASTADIGAASSPFVQITGTTGITSFGTTYSGARYVRFAGALTLTHNATTLILPSGASITTAAGDRAIVSPIGNPASGWQVLAYQKADGTALAGVLPGAIASSGLTTPTATIVGRVTAGTGNVESLTGAQAESLLPINQTRVDVASASTVNLTTGAANTDHINITGTTTITAFTVAAGRLFFVRFAGILTLTNNASIVTQTGANITTQAGDTCIFRATAANTVEVLSYSALSEINLGTSVATTSGTSIDFTGLPSWVRRVTVMLNGVSTNGTSIIQVQLGDGAVQTSGYTGQVWTSTVSSGVVSTGIYTDQLGGAANAYTGVIQIVRQTGNTWIATGITNIDNATNVGYQIFSKIALTNPLDRVRLTTVSGADTFDAGSVNISWE